MSKSIWEIINWKKLVLGIVLTIFLIIYSLNNNLIVLNPFFVNFYVLVSWLLICLFLIFFNFGSLDYLDIMKLDEWRKKAKSSLSNNYGGDIPADAKYEAQFIIPERAGIIHVYYAGSDKLSHEKVAFGDITKGTKNPICSNLETIEWHKRQTNSKELNEVARKYLNPFYNASFKNSPNMNMSNDNDKSEEE